MLTDGDKKILCLLRKNSRETLTKLSRSTGIPISTIYDRIKLHNGSVIKKHTSIVDFEKLGYSARANIALKVEKADRAELTSFLLKHGNVNSAYRTANGFDFIVEAIFRNHMELNDFSEELDKNFQITQKQIYYILEDIKREEFMPIEYPE
jgi:DNA-binding Lrp family transcriptional regulator